MAVAVESVAESNYETLAGTTKTVTKPTGLAEGDLMLAIIGSAGTASVTAHADWYDLDGTVDSITTDGSINGLRIGIQWKVADAADAAASDFTWTVETGVKVAGVIYRISGAGDNPGIIWAQDQVDNSASPSFDNGIYTNVANSLLLLTGIIKNSDSGGTARVSGYAVTTSDPSWTEEYDLTVDSGSVDPVLWGASANRLEVTNTGNSTITFTGLGSEGSADSLGYQIAIVPTISVDATSTLAWETGSATITLSKPTGTVDGDLLVACIGVTENDSSTDTIDSVPSGWTLSKSSINSDNTVKPRLYTYYKVASSEGASWDWTATSSSSYHAGVVYRISGARSASPITAIDDGKDSNDATPEFTGGVTPEFSGLLIMSTVATDASTAGTTTSGYAITTDNPSSWTETLDTYEGDAPDCHMSSVYASRSETTATGDWTLTYSAGSVMDTVSQLMTIPAATCIIVYNTPLILTSTIPNASVTGDCNLTVTPLTMTGTIPDATVTTSDPKWVNTDKSSTSSFTNESKS